VRDIRRVYELVLQGSRWLWEAEAKAREERERGALEGEAG